MNDETRPKTVVSAISRIADKPTGKQACLVVIYGAELGKKYPILGAEVLVGRSSKATIQVDQESVSRHHARLVNTGRSVILRDLESTNGTYVNDDLVDEYVLRDGDLVKIGRTIFKFLTGDNIENAYHEEIYRLTTIDGLTQVYNQRTFLETLEREISRSHRYRRELSLLLFDVDQFGRINDAHGHLAGDSVLKQLAQVIKARIRREDVMARTAGQEFAIVLPEIDSSGVAQLAEKIRKLVEKTVFRFEDTRIAVTISIGVASVDADVHDAAELVRRAGARLQAAKQSGRNRVGT